MPRASTIKTHPRVDEIERDIAKGMTAVALARKYSVSESAIARHKSKRLDALATALDDDTPSAPGVLARLADLADSATRSRRVADSSGSAAVRARAQATELQALNALIDRLGIDDLETVRLAQASGLLVSALRELVEAHPDILPDALKAIRAQHEDFSDLADALAQHMRNRTQNDN